MYALSMNQEYIAKIKFAGTKEKIKQTEVKQGKIHFKNGDSYEGSIKNNLAIGEGKLILNDMSFYQGKKLFI